MEHSSESGISRLVRIVVDAVHADRQVGTYDAMRIVANAVHLVGFDASAHLSEETKKASWSAPIGVISSVGFSSLFGFFVVLTYLFSIQDFDRTLNSEYGQPVLQIFVDVAGERGALAMFSVIMGELCCRIARNLQLTIAFQCVYGIADFLA